MPDEFLGTPMPPEVVLNELDELAAQWEVLQRQKDGLWRCRREKSRRQFRTCCQIWYLEEHGTHLRHLTAQTRNLSERGIGLITRSLIHLGAPIEIRIDAAGRPPTHLGGVVMFCRYAARGFHEVGVVLKAHGHLPIFSEGIPDTVQRIPWAMEALRHLPKRKNRRKPIAAGRR